MSRKNDHDRRRGKAVAVAARLREIHEHVDVLIPMLDEHKIDMLILALGIGRVNLEDDPDAP